jgi:hypothetical protein
MAYSIKFYDKSLVIQNFCIITDNPLHITNFQFITDHHFFRIISFDSTIGLGHSPVEGLLNPVINFPSGSTKIDVRLQVSQDGLLHGVTSW